MVNQRVLLVIIDGLGVSKTHIGNAWYLSNHPNLDFLLRKYPHSLINASGKYVGLPINQMGNSEVGHLNIGAGRIVYTGLSIIDNSLKKNKFYKNQNLDALVNEIKRRKCSLHLICLVSKGGVHSSYNHIVKMLFFFNKKKIRPVIHIISDGRDTDPKSFINLLDSFLLVCKKYNARISTISGRFFAMDRDQRWERTELAYLNMLGYSSRKFIDLKQFVKEQYERNITDEFIEPACWVQRDGKILSIKNNDVIFTINFRSDRMRQLCHCFKKSKLYNFVPKRKINNIYLSTITKYDGIDCDNVIFPKLQFKNVLGDILEKNNLSQLRISETEKYAHVTYFFDGGINKQYKNEKKILIPSPKVKTYDLMPEMSASKITKYIKANIKKFDFILVNYANCDMVGHTGVLKSTIRAIECVDRQIGELYKVCKKNNFTLFVTSDHGNAEKMLDIDGSIVTSHTNNQVFLIISDKKIKILSGGKLSNISPTILSYMGLKIPKEMSENSLIKK